MNIKKLTALLCAVVMVLSLAACGGSGDKAENKHYTVGICQLVQHDALDAATKGFRDAITDALGADNVTFDEQNAAGDSATCATICNGFVSSGVDLILANATGALQAAAADRAGEVVDAERNAVLRDGRAEDRDVLRGGGRSLQRAGRVGKDVYKRQP